MSRRKKKGKSRNVAIDADFAQFRKLILRYVFSSPLITTDRSLGSYLFCSLWSYCRTLIYQHELEVENGFCGVLLIRTKCAGCCCPNRRKPECNHELLQALNYGHCPFLPNPNVLSYFSLSTARWHVSLAGILISSNFHHFQIRHLTIVVRIYKLLLYLNGVLSAFFVQ